MTDTITTEEFDRLVELDRRPSAVQRTVRGTGQAATAYVLLDLAQAFDWLGSATWTPDQWKAVTAASVAAVAAVQNLGPKLGRAIGGWWKRRQGAQ